MNSSKSDYYFGLSFVTLASRIRALAFLLMLKALVGHSS